VAWDQPGATKLAPDPHAVVAGGRKIRSGQRDAHGLWFARQIGGFFSCDGASGGRTSVGKRDAQALIHGAAVETG
jgi:hypothetical protein